MSKKENKIEESKYPYSMEVEGEKFHETGITIRDDFAGCALMGVMMKTHRWEPKAIADMCYKIADAMMEERIK